MTETKTMSPSKSLDVFEFKEEDELTEMDGKKTLPKIGYPDTADKETFDDRGRYSSIPGIDILPRESETEMCMGTDAAGINYNHATTCSFALFETDEFAEAHNLGHVLHSGFKIHEQAADNKSNIIQSGSVFASMDVSVHLTSDADESIRERSPSAIATSSNGPSSHNCFSGWNLDGERATVVFYPDYLEYRGAHCLDSVVRFSRTSVEVNSKTIYGKETIFHIHLDVEDIVKIESQWSARYEAGTINIYFISKDAAEDDIAHNASGIQELKFPSVDSDWYKRLEAIESLDVRYKALRSVLLDIGMEDCLALPAVEAMMLSRSYFPNFDKPFQEVIYPKGDPDAVTISKRDVDLLLPDTFVNDTIIDFYIKYLKTRLNVETTKFHFFNSFFFRKLADMDKDPSSAFAGNAAFQRVRKWTRKVNLLEKDFIFIPVNYNYHWSLIVICYFGEVASYEDDEVKKLERVPCVLHMDSLTGNHLGLRDLIQSYLWEEWKERQKETWEDLHAKFRNLKFIPLDLPQQQNSYDCGLFLLHYVERFLEEVPANFNIYKITPSSKFLQMDWFPPGEASMKRAHIERLINGLLVTHSKDCTPSGRSGMHSSPECPKTNHDYEYGVRFSAKSGTSSGCHESLLCPVGQGIEMNLLPASSVRSTHCTRSSGLILKDLFDPQTEGETCECFVPMGLTDPGFRRLDGVAQESHIFPSSSGDFRSEPVHQPALEVASSPVASEPSSRVGMSDPAGASFSLKNLQEFHPEANQLQANRSSSHRHSSICAADASGDKLGVSESESPNPMVNCSDQAHPLALFSPSSSHQGKRIVGHESMLEPNELHAAKRIRISPSDGWEEPDSSVSEDLQL